MWNFHVRTQKVISLYSSIKKHFFKHIQHVDVHDCWWHINFLLHILSVSLCWRCFCCLDTFTWSFCQVYIQQIIFFFVLNAEIWNLSINEGNNNNKVKEQHTYIFVYKNVIFHITRNNERHYHDISSLQNDNIFLLSPPPP